MKSYDEKQHDALLRYERILIRRGFSEELAVADALLAVGRRPPQSRSECESHDYSEEAIPERDPAYRLPESTGDEEPTVEAVSAAMSVDLARHLQQLGMSRARAVFVASL